MKNLCKLCTFSFLLGAGIAASATTPDKTFVPASDPQIVYMGRTSHTYADSVRYTYPGVSILANFEGTSLRMKTRSNSGYYMVEIDNHPAIKIGVHPDESIITLAEGLQDTVHSARIMYVIEGYELKPAFMGFYLDKGRKLAEAPKLPQRRIEFIGNSITCGYGVEADNPNAPFAYETENHYYTYAALTARALNAQHLVVSRSGIGVYRNYNGPKTGSKDDCMPKMYEQTLFMDPSEQWDHNRYTPDVLCINLGTNDTSLDNYDQALLTDGYRRFVKHLRATYPQTKIVMTSGSMMSGKALEDAKKAMDTVADEMHRQGDNNIYRFDMSPQTGELGYGANYHPSLRQQQKMANELTAFLKQLMGW
ncbi:SGNH/GDSL hydrolase family protein [uncultured Bacteroides sp.]|uniref:SGNH/GDSL hydrolase family protein n=1 Tax=uncultured Bacteroides sp. TaxID=162156 RepID=UPI002622CA6B|nr:SGNH/GDSL hydrolase family protein [uncultured Bacteroides sp.]